MILELGKIESFPARVVVQSSKEGIPSESEDVWKISFAKATIDIQQGNNEFFCQGVVTGTIELECARCLASFEIKIESKIDFILCDKDRLKTITAEGLDSEDYIILSNSDMTADISSVVRQVFLLSVSMKPVCSENCRGLCSKCGTNLNTKPCNCETGKADPRWDGLKKLAINNH